MVMNRHLKYFSGGLDTSSYSSDGTFTLAWISGDGSEKDSDKHFGAKSMVIFHAVTLMPPGINNRKRHVGNDVVHIIYVETCEADKFGLGNTTDNQCSLISGEFGIVTIFVVPLQEKHLMQVTVRARNGLDFATSSAVAHLLGTCIIPNESAASFVRQIAIRADVACRCATQDRLGRASNWEERLVQLCELERYALRGDKT
mmetsp:Transcript_37049/g.110967  ORF Transcript_37049/g.110967 Transcript_37049/m.110967 type:complete len:201 (+) Transcript_37049:2774-3376(+)